MQSSSRKLLVVVAVALALAYAIYRSSGMIHGASFSGTRLFEAVRGANPYLLILSVVAISFKKNLRSLRWLFF